MDEKKEKGFELTKTQKRALNVIGAVAVYAIGYTIGKKVEAKLIANAIGACWAKDPTLEEHMWKVANELKVEN